MGPGMGPCMEPGMRHGMEPGMRPGMGPGMRPGKGCGMWMMQQSPAMMEQMRKMQQLRKEARELGMKYQQAQSAEEKKKIEPQLRQKLDEIYSLKLEIMRERAKMIDNHLNTVTQEISNYEKDKNSVTNSWFDQLTGKGRYMRF